MENSKIEWTDHTFSAWVGCTKVSPACDRCYAESWAKRTGQPGLWAGERRRTSESNWKQPLKWNRQAEAEGVRKRVFCASLADVFDNQVHGEWRVDLWKLIENTVHLDWLLLTKRPQNIRKMIPVWWHTGDMPPNVWMGTTAENQEEAERRIPHLLAAPARIKFISAEPLLGPIDFFNMKELAWGAMMRGDDPRLHWIIVGGESGPGARPMHPDWARSIRDQCAAVGVPFLFKQWGEWHVPNAFVGKENIAPHTPFVKVGKKRAGRLLDGRTHDGFPA